MDERNRREMTRVPLRLDVILRSKSSPAMPGKTTDVSLKGIHIDCGNPLPVGSICQLTLLVGLQADPIRIELGGTVVRADKNGMAVEIETYCQLIHSHTCRTSYDIMQPMAIVSIKNSILASVGGGSRRFPMIS